MQLRPFSNKNTRSNNSITMKSNNILKTQWGESG